VPQKEPSPLLDKKIEELEAKFADMTDEELEDLGEDEGDLADQSLPPLQRSLASEMDVMPYTPPQVCWSLPQTPDWGGSSLCGWSGDQDIFSCTLAI